MADSRIISELLVRNEGKTLEFKENCRPMRGILRTVVAFANTAGGILVIGIRDHTKEVVGLLDSLQDEERLANTFADNIRPILIPDIQIELGKYRLPSSFRVVFHEAAESIYQVCGIPLACVHKDCENPPARISKKKACCQRSEPAQETQEKFIC